MGRLRSVWKTDPTSPSQILSYIDNSISRFYDRTMSGSGAAKLLFILTVSLFFLAPHSLAETDEKAALIDQAIEKHKSEITKIRRFLHMNPELSNREYETSKLIASKLLSLGLEVESGIARTGVTGLLHGHDPGFTIGLRGDMDALPIEEQTGVSFQSLNPGVMHACGHDVHTAIVLGTAMVLSTMKDHIQGSIKFIFQPSEEGAPKGEEGGASLMIKEGVLEDPPVRAIFGLHVWPDADVGYVLFSPGPIMAGADGFDIIIKGKSSHAARPSEGIDAIALSAQTVVSIYSGLNRMIPLSDPAIVSIGKISGGTRSNIIAEEVRLEGTVRTLSQTNRSNISAYLEESVKGITRAAGATYTFNYRQGTPPLYNHPELAAIMLPTLQRVMGKTKVLELQPQMIAEDFAVFCQKTPGFYFFLGVKTPGRRTMPPLHSPYFLPDERSILVGVRIFSHMLLDCLEYQTQFDERSH